MTRAAERSIQANVRNPVLDLPGVQALRALPADQRAAICAALASIRADAEAKAQKCWKKRKGPMGAYWMAVGVYAGHIRRAIRP